MYGNEQSQYTMYRASYGDTAASMMMGAHTVYGGAYNGINNMLSDVGGMIMPVGYSPPARANVGFYGQYPQKTGFFSSAAGAMGLSSPGRSQMAADYYHNVGSDFGERLGGGIAGLATTAAGMGVGSAMSAALGGGILASLGAFTGATLLSGAVMDGVGQRREINNFLQQSSFRYVGTGNPLSDSLRGGMNTDARRQTTDFVRQMDFKDPAMSTEDLTMVLQQGTQKGMFTGVQSMDDFKKKFKDLTDTVKVVTRTLGQTLDEAMSTIKELKSIGVDPTQARGMVGSADMLGRMAGRTGAEMLNIGLQGAEMFRGTGVSMSIGAQASMMNLASVRASRDAGLLSSEAVAQAGGEEALALRMNASGMAFGQSTLGRGLGAAFFGGAGVGFNQQGFMNAMMGGNMSITQMAMQAAGNLGSPAALVSYQANQAKFMSEMGKTFGGQGLQIAQIGTAAANAEFLQQSVGGKGEDNLRFSFQQMGMSEPEIEANLARIKGAASNRRTGNQAAYTQYQRNLIEEGYRGNVFYQAADAVVDAGKKMVDSFAKPIEGIIDSVVEGSLNISQKQFAGVNTASVSGIGLTRTIRGSRNRSSGTADLDEGGIFATTTGEAIDTVLSNGNFAKAMGINVREIGLSGGVNQGETVINNIVGGLGGRRVVNLEQAKKAAQDWNFTADEVKKEQEAGTFKDIKGGTILDMMSSGLSINRDDIDSVSLAAYGKRAKDLSKQEKMKLMASTDGTAYGKVVEGAMKTGQVLSGTDLAVNTQNSIKAVESYTDARAHFKASISTGIRGDAPFMRGGGLDAVNALDNLDDDALQILADASGAPPAEREKAMKDAAATLTSKLHTSIPAAQAIVKEAMKHTKAASNMATGHTALKKAQEVLGSGRLSAQMTRDITTSSFSKDEVAKATNLAAGLAGANLEQFMSLTDGANDALLDKMGSSGKSLQETRKLLVKIEKGKIGKGAVFESALKEAGMSPDQSLLTAFATTDMSNTSAKQKLVEQIYQASKQQAAGTSLVNSPGGVSPEGGPNALKTLEQQVNMNNQIYVALESVARRLKL